MDPTRTYPELERLLTHQDWLRSLARKLVGDSQAAEDLVQETWMAAMKSPPDPTRPARPWLAGVVRRLASMRARGEGRRTRRQNSVAVADVLPSTADLVEEVDTQRRLVGEVLKLSEPYRTTVMLRYFNNLSSAEIARHQDVPAGTVRWRLKRGLDELRERLDDSFGDRDTWCMALLPMAKLGIGAGAGAGAAGGGTTLTGFMSSIGLAKFVAGLLALLGVVYVASIVGDPADRVFASHSSAELASLEQEEAAPTEATPKRSEAELISRDLVAPAERRVRFLKPNQEPIVGMSVVLMDEDDSGQTEITDETGVVAFTTTLERGNLYIRRANSFVELVPIAFNAPRVDAIMPRNGDLTGRVMAGEGEQSGSLALEGVTLRLDSDVSLWGGELLPRVVSERFEDPGIIEVVTDASGEFHFENLPSDWSGKLWLPDGVAVMGASRRDEAGRYVYFNQPERNKMVLVQSLPRLRGRLVGADGNGLANANVRCWVDGASMPIETHSDPDGLFELLLDSDGSLGLRLEAVSADGASQRNLSMAGADVPSDFELGDVALMATTRIAFRAFDPSGLPVSGARGQSGDELTSGAPSDEAGFGDLILPPKATDCWIVAPGYRPSELTLNGTTEERQVELTKATTLHLHVLDSDNLSMSEATIRLWSGERLFAFGDSYRPARLDEQLMVGSFSGLSEDEDLPHSEFVLDGRGMLRVVGLVSGAPLWVEVVDKLGQPLHQQQVSAMESGEERSEQVVVPRTLREFHGIVRDRANNVLVGVNVELVDVDGLRVSTVSSLEGHVHFQDLAGDHYNIKIDKRGFVAQEILDYAIGSGAGATPAQPAEFLLDRGTDLAVLIVDGDDQPVYGGQVTARRLSDSKGYLASPEGAADQTLQDLDQGAIELTLILGGVEYVEVMQAPLEQSVEFRVPAHGQAEVVWNLPEAFDSELPVRLIATALSETGEVLVGRIPVVTTIGARTGNSGVTKLQSLLPGTYSVQLWQPAPIDEASSEGVGGADGSPDVNATPQWIAMSELVLLQVQVGEEAAQAQLDCIESPR